MTAQAELPNGWRFEEPPAASPRGAVGADYSPLMQHPKRWVLIDPRCTSSSKGHQAAKAATKRHGGTWNGVSRRNKALADGKPTWRVYLAYIGPEVAA